MARKHNAKHQRSRSHYPAVVVAKYDAVHGGAR